MSRLDHKVAIVTGAGSGIGAAVARELGRAGASVVLTDLNKESLDRQLASLAEQDIVASAQVLDVTDEQAWIAVVNTVAEELGALHVLVNNAGITRGGSVESTTEADFDAVLDVLLKGGWFGMKHCGPKMRVAGGGSIVNIASVMSAVGGFGNAAAYHAGKGAITSLTKSAAVRWATEGVRVNSVHPGFITTELTSPTKGTDREAQILERTPMNRWGMPTEIARAVVFLASDDASFITGAELYVDGGFTAV